MQRDTARRAGILAGAAGVLAAVAATALGSAISGPSSSESPYVLRSEPGVVTRSILTVGDSVNAKPDGTPYRMVGLPDGLGAFDNGNGTFTVLMNHEVRETSGAVRAHGARGAFVSRWTIEKGSLRALAGEDLIKRVATWNTATGSYNAPAPGVVIGRLCSADLAAPGAFYNPETGNGYDGRLLLNGEETGTEGRAFAHALDGTSYQLPHLGRFSWENAVAHPGTGDATVVVGTDDTGPGQVYVYVGQKRSTGNPVERAGLVGGTLYALKVVGFPTEPADAGIPSGTPFELVAIGDASTMTGAQIEAASVAGGATGFQRPEDGSWDPWNVGDFYFVTTASFDGRSRLWRLNFVDPANPAGGGRIDMLLDGTEGQRMMDNITVSDRGSVLMQEDPGNQAYLARIWRYSVRNDRLDEVARHDPRRFLAGGQEFLTQDEESSGIIPVDDILGEGWFLLDVQAHYGIPGELVEGGQLLALHVPPGRLK
jgi:uncharacterized protein DUF839